MCNIPRNFYDFSFFKKENIQQMVNISLAKIQNPWSV